MLERLGGNPEILFDLLDKDSSGLLDVDELRLAFKVL